MWGLVRNSLCSRWFWCVLKFENPVIGIWALDQYFCRKKKRKESIRSPWVSSFLKLTVSLPLPLLLLPLLHSELLLWESDTLFGGFGVNLWTRMKFSRRCSIMMVSCPDLVTFLGFIKFCCLCIYYRYTDSPNCYYELDRNSRCTLFYNLELASACRPFLEKLKMFYSFLK